LAQGAKARGRLTLCQSLAMFEWISDSRRDISRSYPSAGASSPCSGVSGLSVSRMSTAGGKAPEWTSSVCCASIEEVDSSAPSSFEVSVDGKLSYVLPRYINISELLQPYASHAIAACTEWREPFNELQQWLLIFYHSFAVLEIEGGGILCTEKYNDKLQIMSGKGDVVHAFMTQYRANGFKRCRCSAQPRRPLDSPIFVRDFLAWINGPLAKAWQPYSLLSSNCQHYTGDLQLFLEDPSKVEELRSDIQVVLPAVRRCGLHLQFASPDLRRERKVVLAAVTENGFALHYAGDEMKRDREVVLAAVRSKGLAFQLIMEDFADDREVVLAAVLENCSALMYVSPKMRADRDILMTAVLQDGNTLEAASGDVNDDYEVVLAAVSGAGLALQFASERLRASQAIVLAALEKNGMALQYVSDELRQDRAVVQCAVLENGMALQFAGDALKSDFKLVFSALRKNAMALKFASDNLKRNREFVLAAVQWDGMALQFASEELKMDREVMIAAKM